MGLQCAVYVICTVNPYKASKIIEVLCLPPARGWLKFNTDGSYSNSLMACYVGCLELIMVISYMGTLIWLKHLDLFIQSCMVSFVLLTLSLILVGKNCG